ncbi:hypothetical protein N1Z32_005581, partial [Klebsiella pneumoniae]
KKPVKHYSTSAGGLFLSGLSLSDNMMCEVRTRHTAAFNIRVLGRTSPDGFGANAASARQNRQ